MFSHITGLRPAVRSFALVSIFCFLAQAAVAQVLNAPLQSALPAPLPATGPIPSPGAQWPPQTQAPAPTPQYAPVPAAPVSSTLPLGSNALVHHVQSANDRMEMLVSSSRIVTLDQNIPRAQVNNKEVAELTALSPNEIQVFAKKAGVTQINLWTDKGQIYTIDLVVLGDARELQELLRSQFPGANLDVRPMGSGVLIKGFVDRADVVSQIIQIAQDYYPKVIPDIRVGGVQQILLHVKVAEVSRTKFRNLGFDWAAINGRSFAASSVSSLLVPGSIAGAVMPSASGDTFRFGVLDGNNAFFGFLNALRKDDLLKIVADPTLVTVSGRPAQFKAGGEIPYPASATLNGVSVAYKDTGITVDFVPIVLGNGNIRLEVRPVDRELDETKSFLIAPNTPAPAFTQRMVDTGVEMQPGQTLAIAGLISKRTVAERREIPWLGEMPYVGAAFRQNNQTEEEVELIFIVTPEVVAPLDPCEVPPCLPGMHSDAPTDCEMFWKGYIEVPSHGPCGPCGPNGCAPSGGPMDGGPGGSPNFDAPMRSYEQIPSGVPQPGLPTPANPSAGMPSAMYPGYPPRSPSDANNRYNSSRPQEPRSASSINRAGTPSGIVGPTGYDVLN